MKEFEEQILMLLKVSLGAVHADRKEMVDKFAVEVYDATREVINKYINEENANSIEVLSAVYAALYETHTVISDYIEGDE